MVRTLQPPYDPLGWAAVMFAGASTWPPELPQCLLVHEYSEADLAYMICSRLTHSLPDQATARLAALDFARHSQILVDLSPYIHGSPFPGLFCPVLPRWCIYHGIRGEPLHAALYWDWWNDGFPTFELIQRTKR